MSIFRRRSPSHWTPLALACTLAMAACDNPVGDEHEDHPVALVISDAQGQRVVTLRSNTDITGQLTGSVGSARVYTVAALGEDGDELALDGEELAVRVTNPPQQATVAVQGANQLVVTGIAAGSGSVRVDLLHQGHAELGGPVAVVIQ